MDDRTAFRRGFRFPWLSRGWVVAATRRFLAVATLGLVVVGPWPVDDSTFVGSDYQRRTLHRLARAPGALGAGPIRVGTAEVDLAPSVARPLAGFIGQIRSPFVGIDSPCRARAVTVASSTTTVTILTADLLLINAKLSRAVVERAGLRPEEVYVTASHTHGGPGGWGDHPLEMLVAGAYDPAAFEELASRLGDVVRRSRLGLVPAEVGFVEVQAPGWQKNRIEPGSPTHDALSAVVFRPVAGGPPLAILAVFGAHATVSHPVPPRLGGDYPAALVREVQKRTGGGSVLFAAGAVGDASPARPRAASQQKSAEALGEGLASDLVAALPSAQFERSAVVANLRLEVDLPVLRLPFACSWLRFSPIASWWIAGRTTHLHALRLGPVVLVGFPGDYSGHLADRLTDRASPTAPRVVATSFNGDFKGYLVSSEVFWRRACYETRWMSFFGPWTGDYLTDLARRMVAKLSSPELHQNDPAARQDQTGARVFAALLLVAAARGWFRSRAARRWSASPDWMTHGLVFAAVGSVGAFMVAPDSVAWARVGLPALATQFGQLVGVLALIGTVRDRPIRGLLAVAGFLLTGSWLVILAGLRWGLTRLVVPDGRNRGEDRV